MDTTPDVPEPHLYEGYSDEECLTCWRTESDPIHIEPSMTINVAIPDFSARSGTRGSAEE